MSTNDPVPADLSKAAQHNLQCNILRSTGRPRSTQVFHRFGSPKQLAQWLLRKQMPSPTPAGNEDGVDQVVTLLFSAEALRWLVPPELVQKLDAMDPAFLRGVRHADSSRRLKADPTTWGPHEGGWHVVELYAHDAKPTFTPAQSPDCVIEHASGYQNGKKLTERDQESYGHFNIRDGLSMPVYTPEDYAKLKTKLNKTSDDWTHDPRHALSTLLVRDPLVDNNESFGSYFAFLKYKQDKKKFAVALKNLEKAMADRRTKKSAGSNVLTVESVYVRLAQLRGGQLAEELKRHVFGRDSKGMTAFGTDDNDFDFNSDPHGRQCPFQSHMRKMNPRGGTGDVAHERSKTIARRGTSYYKTRVCGKQPQVKNGTGLLFWSAQASIFDQLEFMMETWAHAAKADPDHLPTPDFDAVIGRPDRNSPSFASWQRWKATTDMDFSIWDSVDLIGGEYLFAPSIDGVSMLKKFAETK